MFSPLTLFTVSLTLEHALLHWILDSIVDVFSREDFVLFLSFTEVVMSSFQKGFKFVRQPLGIHCNAALRIDGVISSLSFWVSLHLMFVEGWSVISLNSF